MTMNTTEASAPQRKIVDAFTRTLHALMAVSFGLAYLTSEMDGLRWLHVTFGYTLGAVFLLRLVWSGVGPRRVSLWALGGRLSGIYQMRDFIADLEWPAMLKLVLACSMVALLGCVLPLVVSGYLTYFGMLGEWAEEVHEAFANAMLLAVGGHVATVVLLTRGTSGHAVRPMLTGRLKGKGPDLVEHNLVSVAIFWLLLTASFWSWQTWQYIHDPQFKHQPRWLHPEGGYQEEKH